MESPVEEPVEEEIIEYIPEIITKIVIDYVLHGDLIKVQEVTSNPKNRFIYFYRKTDEGIPYFDNEGIAEKEMPAYFLVGLSTGSVLHSLNFYGKNVSLTEIYY